MKKQSVLKALVAYGSKAILIVFAGVVVLCLIYVVVFPIRIELGNFIRNTHKATIEDKIKETRTYLRTVDPNTESIKFTLFDPEKDAKGWIFDEDTGILTPKVDGTIVWGDPNETNHHYPAWMQPLEK